MTGEAVVISRPLLRTSHGTVVGFLRAHGRTIRSVRVRLSDAFGIAVDERRRFNDSTDAAALAEDVAEHIVRSATGRSSSPSRMTNSARFAPAAL
jgi:hypothetical protein